MDAGNYLIRVSGSGRIGSLDWCYSIPLDDWVQDATRARGEYQAGVGLVGTDGIFFATAARAINMYKDLGMSVSFNRIEVDYSLQKSIYSPATTDALAVYKDDHAGTIQPPALESVDAVDGDNQTLVIIGSSTLSTIYIGGASMADNSAPYSPYGGYIKVHAVRLYGEGDSPFGEENCAGEGQGGAVYADAIFYTEDNWETVNQAPNDTFLFLDSAAIPALAALPFSSSHVYEFPLTWAGGLADWSFLDSYDSNYANNANTYLRVEVIPV